MNNYTFNPSTRYITRGISEELPLELQISLWNLVDEMVLKDMDTDYLQVFDFKITESHLEITHRQEEPPFSHTIKYQKQEGYEVLHAKKVYCIDDISHSTMLFSSEY